MHLVQLKGRLSRPIKTYRPLVSSVPREAVRRPSYFKPKKLKKPKNLKTCFQPRFLPALIKGRYVGLLCNQELSQLGLQPAGKLRYDAHTRRTFWNDFY